MSKGVGLQKPGVLILSASRAIGGVERIVVNLTRELTRRGRGVSTVFPNLPQSSILIEWCAQQDTRAELGPAALDVYAHRSLKDILLLSRYIRRIPADVVNIHWGATWISLKDVLAIRLARRRCIVSIHGAWRMDPAYMAHQIRMTRLAARFSHGVVVVTNASRKVLEEAGVPPSRIRLIPCGLTPPGPTLAKADARAALGLPPNAFVIVSAGRLVVEKGFADLIEAVAQLPRDADGPYLVIAGDGPDQALFQALAGERLPGRVRMLGMVNDMNPVYASGDVFALATYDENAGLVYREAAFHGLPSVGTLVGGNPETILDGKTGLLVPVRNPAALAEALQTLRCDQALRAYLGEAARTRACAEFTDEAMVDRYEKVLWPGGMQVDR